MGIRREIVRSDVVSRRFTNGSTKPLLAGFVERSALEEVRCRDPG